MTVAPVAGPIDPSDLLCINQGYLTAYTLFNAFSVFYCAWAIAGNGNTADVFQDKFGWDDDETILYNTIISSFGIVGLAVGSFLGGELITRGRRKAFMAA